MREGALERLQPALGGELRRPHHVDGDDVVAGVLGLHVLHDVVVLLVGVVGLLLERDLLARGGPRSTSRWSAPRRCCCPCPCTKVIGPLLLASAFAAPPPPTGRGAVAPAAGGRSQRHGDGGGEQDLCAASFDLSGHQAVSVSLWTCRRPSRLGTEGSAGPSKSAFAGSCKRNGCRSGNDRRNRPRYSTPSPRRARGAAGGGRVAAAGAAATRAAGVPNARRPVAGSQGSMPVDRYSAPLETTTQPPAAATTRACQAHARPGGELGQRNHLVRRADCERKAGKVPRDRSRDPGGHRDRTPAPPGPRLPRPHGPGPLLRRAARLARDLHQRRLGRRRAERTTTPAIALQLAPDHQPPVWGDATRPQQAHVDVMVDDRPRPTRRCSPSGAAPHAGRRPG